MEHSRVIPAGGCEHEDISLYMDEIAATHTRQNGANLFTTKTCPNCSAAKTYLKDFPYVLVDAEENPELTREYGVMQAPTLVVIKDGQHKKYANASNIKSFTEELSAGVR